MSAISGKIEVVSDSYQVGYSYFYICVQCITLKCLSLHASVVAVVDDLIDMESQESCKHSRKSRDDLNRASSLAEKDEACIIETGFCNIYPRE